MDINNNNNIYCQQHIARFEGDVINDNGDNLRPNQYPLVATQKKYINNNNNIYCQQHVARKTTHCAAQRR